VRVALLFIDGVGVGAAEPAVNPLARGPFLRDVSDVGRLALSLILEGEEGGR